jgi:hypothetical protein
MKSKISFGVTNLDAIDIYEHTNAMNRYQTEQDDVLIIPRGSAVIGNTLDAGVFDKHGVRLVGTGINIQWQKFQNDQWVNIVGETSCTIKLANSLLGQQIRVIASYSQESGDKTLASKEILVTGKNLIVLENQKTGTRNWQLSDVATRNEIAGYADASSINLGQALNLKISLAQAGEYNIDVYRLGYYGGMGGRLITHVMGLTGEMQPEPIITNARTNLVEYKWHTSYTLQTNSDWSSGFYLIKLTDSRTGKQNYIQFVLRDDNRPADIGFQDAINTAVAYNNIGGYSVYDFNSLEGQRAYQVSFDRPFQYDSGVGSEQFNNMLTWEYNMVRWLESQGYDVTYYTNLDVDTNQLHLYSQKIFLSVGHDEYWSMSQRNHVQQARDNGINLAFFSANTAYWQVRFEPSSAGQANRVMTIYKDTSGIGTGQSLDPIVQKNLTAATTLFRSPEVNRPENELLGVGYIGDWGSGNLFNGFDYVVSNAADPYYANTGLKDGERLKGLVGYEWDGLLNNDFTPAGLVVLSESPVKLLGQQPPVPLGCNTEISNAVRYTAKSGAKVFSTGSIQWVWGLDNYRITKQQASGDSWLTRTKNLMRSIKKILQYRVTTPKVTQPRVDVRAQQIAVNVFADMGVKPQTPAAKVVVPYIDQ